jgi:Protein of unknown function (DUF2442)
VASIRLDGIRFVVYSNDHPPRQVHGILSEVEVIINLRADGAVSLAARKDRIRPANEKRATIKRILQTAAENFNCLQIYGKGFMAATHKVITTDEEIDAAIVLAANSREGERAVSANYHAGLDLFVVTLSDGGRLVLQRELLEGLQTANRRQLANVEITPLGSGLHWPDLDVDLYVSGLIRNVYGTSQWMSRIGKRGGAARTSVKAEASRINGRSGGRPRKAVAS